MKISGKVYIFKVFEFDHFKASYNDFVVKYESGMTIMKIVNQGDISRRTAYRYKAYYDELRKLK